MSKVMNRGSKPLVSLGKLQKSFKKLIRSHPLFSAVIIAVFICGIGFLIWSTSTQPKQYLQIHNEGRTYTSEGKVTEKYTSCSKEILKIDGTVERDDGLCDAGNSLVVDGLHISTGGGGLTMHPPEYITDISSLHAGDAIEVRYVKSEAEGLSTNCESCYIKKDSSSKREPQNKQER